MWIQRLRIQQFRCIAQADLTPSPGLNVILGGNGAGKTSVLEAIVVASSGRSFRTSRPDEMCVADEALQVVVDVQGRAGAGRIGVQREQRRWQARFDGQAVRSFAEIADRLAVEVFEPNSHDIVSGGGESRRRFLDWGVFHVEHTFGPNWARYQRALRQRNVLLRSGTASRTSVAPWDRELASAGTELSVHRETFMQAFQPVLELQMATLAPELGRPEIRLRRGWSTDSLEHALADGFERDVAVGHTTRGPHRADWTLRFSEGGSRERWSRGQQKIAVFGLCRSMLDVYAALRGEPAVACLDDVFSELDEPHQRLCLASLQTANAQIWLTGTDVGSAINAWNGDRQVFHVEHGVISPVANLTL